MDSKTYLEQLRSRRQEKRQQPARPAEPTYAQTSASMPTPTSMPDPSRDSRSKALKESEIFPGQYRPLPEETVLEWSAPSRPYKQRNKQFYMTIVLITVLISLILFFLGNFLPIAVVISVAFLAYVLSSVPPDDVTNKITTYGIRFQEELYYWEELGRFWFDHKYDQKTLNIELFRFPGRLTLLLGDQTEENLADILKEVLLQEKPKDTSFDKAAKWLQDKLPLE